MTIPAASAIIPCLRYRDAHAAIAWLEQAFDFKPQAVYADGAIVYHAQLDYGGRGYACRDLEGHLWWFGSYDPWQPGHPTA